MTEKETTEETGEEVEKTEEEIMEDAEKTIRNHVLSSMGVGLIPIPLVDLVALSGVQLNMTRRLAMLYDIPFSKDKGKHMIAALLGSSVPISLGEIMGSLVKSIPVIGQTTGVLAMPVVAGAMTYALGKVFLQHFACGGTFLNFNPDEVREYYSQMFSEGKKMADTLKKETDKKK